MAPAEPQPLQPRLRALDFELHLEPTWAIMGGAHGGAGPACRLVSCEVGRTSHLSYIVNYVDEGDPTFLSRIYGLSERFGVIFG